MRKLLATWFAVSLTLFPLVSIAQAQEPIDREMIAKIREESPKAIEGLRDLHSLHRGNRSASDRNAGA
jgi:hypothetical protein